MSVASGSVLVFKAGIAWSFKGIRCDLGVFLCPFALVTQRNNRNWDCGHGANQEGDQAACPGPWPVWARGRLFLFLGSPMICLHLPASAEPCLGGACTVTDHTSSLPRPCPGGFAHHLHIFPQQVVSSFSHRAQGISPGNQHRGFSVEKQTSHLPPTALPNETRTPCPELSLQAEQPWV